MIEKSFIGVLRTLQRMKPDDFSHLIDHLNDKSVDNICECVYNVVNTDLKLTRKKKLALKRHINKKCNVKRIKTITNKNTPIFKRRKALKQEGKGLPMLLASVIPFLISLFK